MYFMIIVDDFYIEKQNPFYVLCKATYVCAKLVRRIFLIQIYIHNMKINTVV